MLRMYIISLESPALVALSLVQARAQTQISKVICCLIPSVGNFAHTIRNLVQYEELLSRAIETGVSWYKVLGPCGLEGARAGAAAVCYPGNSLQILRGLLFTKWDRTLILLPLDLPPP